MAGGGSSKFSQGMIGGGWCTMPQDEQFAFGAWLDQFLHKDIPDAAQVEGGASSSASSSVAVAASSSASRPVPSALVVNTAASCARAI